MINNNKKILVLRFSAIGDVALTIPVIFSFLEKYQNYEITFITDNKLKKIFPKHPRLKLRTFEIKLYNNIFKIQKLKKKIFKNNKFDFIIDLHNVLRTKIILNNLNNKNISILKKNRLAKKNIIKRKSEIYLNHITNDYKDAFTKLGFNFEIIKQQYLGTENSNNINEFIQENSIDLSKTIGFAAFSVHFTKILPLNKTVELTKKLTQKGYNIIFFGGGKKEYDLINQIIDDIPNTYSIINKFDFDSEFYLISKLKAMISMDSSNMHFASLCNTRVYSIWGATSPKLGFWPLWNEKYIYENNLECNPCSRYGSETCKLKHFNCLNNFSVYEFVSFIEKND